MDVDDSTQTSWGKGSGHLDVRALRRYNRILAALSSVAEWLAMALIPAILVGVIWLVFYTNFENAIFYDGTDMICVFNGDTGEIRYVR